MANAIVDGDARGDGDTLLDVLAFEFLAYGAVKYGGGGGVRGGERGAEREKHQSCATYSTIKESPLSQRSTILTPGLHASITAAKASVRVEN